MGHFGDGHREGGLGCRLIWASFWRYAGHFGSAGQAQLMRDFKV